MGREISCVKGVDVDVVGGKGNGKNYLQKTTLLEIKFSLEIKSNRTYPFMPSLKPRKTFLGSWISLVIC